MVLRKLSLKVCKVRKNHWKFSFKLSHSYLRHHFALPIYIFSKKKNFTNLPIERARSINLHNEKNEQMQRARLMGGNWKKLCKSLDFAKKKVFGVSVKCYKRVGYSKRISTRSHFSYIFSSFFFFHFTLASCLPTYGRVKQIASHLLIKLKLDKIS